MFLTFVNCIRCPKPDHFWKWQQQLRFSWRFRSRPRNCYVLGIRYVHKALTYSRKWRKLKKMQMRQLWTQRLEAATQEHGVAANDFLEGLARSRVELDRKVLTDLAIYEPRSFKSLVEIARQRLADFDIQAQAPAGQNSLHGVWRIPQVPADLKNDEKSR